MSIKDRQSRSMERVKDSSANNIYLKRKISHLFRKVCWLLLNFRKTIKKIYLSDFSKTFELFLFFPRNLPNFLKNDSRFIQKISISSENILILPTFSRLWPNFWEIYIPSFKVSISFLIFPKKFSIFSNSDFSEEYLDPFEK